MKNKLRVVGVLLAAGLFLGSCNVVTPPDAESSGLSETVDEPTVTLPEETVEAAETAETTISVEPFADSLVTYETALAHLEAGEIEEAYDLLLTIREYRDVSDYLERFSVRYTARMRQTPQSADCWWYEHDACGRLVKEWIFKGKEVYINTYEYDAKGNLIRQTVGSQTTTYEYDEAGNLIRHTSPSGGVTEAEYDTNGNMTEKTYRPSASQDVTTTERYEYDARGRKLSYQYIPANGEDFCCTYEYDENGNLMLERRTGPREGSGASTSYEYDSDGNLVREYMETLSTSQWHRYDYEYDADGRMTKCVYTTDDGYEGVTTWEYDERGNLLLKQLLSRTVSGQLQSPSLQDQWQTTSYRYEYDGAGNCIKYTYAYSDVESVTEYEYDSQGNLVKEIRGGETDSPSDYNVTTYTGYELYYNPCRAKEIPDNFGGK